MTPLDLCERWVRLHSVLMLGVVTGCAWSGRPEWLALYAALAFSILLALLRGHWTKDGRFGLPNAITSLRLLITVLLLAFPNLFSAWAVALLAFSTCVADMLDGWLARRSGLASDFGACYDVEADSLLTVTLPLLLVQRGLVGPWLLGVGYWHYVYCLVVSLIRPRVLRLPRSRLARYVYASMMGSFLLGFVLPPSWTPPLAAFGACAVSLSFLRSFWQHYAPTRPSESIER